jgi:ATP-binding cassette subfamily B protein
MSREGQSDFSILKRLLLEARSYWPHLGLILALDLLATPLSLFTPLPMKLAVDSVIGSEPVPSFLAPLIPMSVQQSTEKLLLFTAALLIAVATLSRLNNLFQSVFSTSTSGRITLKFRSKMFWHGQNLSLGFHDQKGVSHALYRVEYDALAIRWVAIDGLIPMVAAFVSVISMIAVIALINLKLALVALVVVPLIIALIKGFRLPLRRGWRKQNELSNEALSVINEVFSALRVVKAFSQEEPERERYTSHASQSLAAQVRMALLQGTFNVLTGIVIAVGTGIVLFVGVEAIQAGVMTIGDLLVVMAYLTLLYSPLQVIGSQLAGMQQSLASAERAFEFLDEHSEVPEHRNPLRLARAKGSFELKDMTFGYEPGRPVLEKVSLSIPAGSKVGIAGPTGAGKTTLVSLLMRFYDPTSGIILLDGNDIRHYDLRDLRKQYGIVLQEPVLFSNSILENIAYGSPSASKDQIVAAAKAANAHEFIESLPEGYETLVGERGMRLSGGERQRISLARAFLRDAPILLLDEPTSSVDIKTEAIIIEAMERLMEGRTTFLIAHRLSTLENCDVLLEVRNGKVIRHEGGGRFASSIYQDDPHTASA